MTKEQAIQLMEQGKRVTHRYFSPDEFITIKDGKVITEEGYPCTQQVFWSLRKGDAWNEDWEEFTKQPNLKIMTPQLYKERSANDLPKKEGQYFVIMVNPSTNEVFPSTEQFKDGKWTFNNAIVRWLEPVEETKGKQLYRWVKASERLPHTYFLSDEYGTGSDTIPLMYQGVPYAGRYIVEAGVTKECFVIAGIGFYGKGHLEQIEWLEPYTPSLNAGSLEEAAKQYSADYIKEEYGDVVAMTVVEAKVVGELCFLAGAAYVKGGEEWKNKAIGVLRKIADVDFPDPIKTAIQELLNQKEGK